MSRTLPARQPKQIDQPIDSRAAVGGSRKVARCFVPGYGTGAAIRLSPNGARHAIARRRLARLIERRRRDS